MAASAIRSIEANISASNQIRDRVLAFIVTVWDGLTSWRDADIAAFVARVLPIVLAGQRQMSALTDAYLAQVAQLVLGSGAPVGIPAAEVTGEALRGVPPEEVYARPGVTVWAALALGRPLDVAVRKGRERALTIAATDLQLARTRTAQLILGRDRRVVGYRRTLSGSEDCPLCELASRNVYRRGDLMPIHPKCDCGVAPVYGNADPAAGLAGDERPEDVRVAVHEHGEIGPVLTVAGEHFTGPSDI